MSDSILKRKLSDFYKILAYNNIGDLNANHASMRLRFISPKHTNFLFPALSDTVMMRFLNVFARKFI